MGVMVRDLAAADRAAVQDALIDCGAFTEDEVRVALEMVDAGLSGDYSLLAVEVGGEAAAARQHRAIAGMPPELRGMAGMGATMRRAVKRMKTAVRPILIEAVLVTALALVDPSGPAPRGPRLAELSDADDEK